MAPLAALTQLHTLCGSFNVCGEDWRVVAGLEQLKTLNVCTLDLDAASPASSSLSDLEVMGDLMIQTDVAHIEWDEDAEEAVDLDARYTGLLPRVVPALERLAAGGSLRCRLGLPTIMAGHGKLRVLGLRDMMVGEEVRRPAWRAGTLSLLPCLEEVLLLTSREVHVDGMLRDAAGCSKLGSMQVDCRGGERWLRAEQREAGGAGSGRWQGGAAVPGAGWQRLPNAAPERAAPAAGAASAAGGEAGAEGA
jgi:hypothetical protein